ncbi:MAG: hypothetical protein LBN43_04205 [Oscillospiraceae bacterium]|jgi:hypothetical protein|nr:hypothetical protein [Oscillospiraceae bacterium]
MSEKSRIYNRLSRVLTDYESHIANESELYDMLVEIQRRWEDTITAETDAERQAERFDWFAELIDINLERVHSIHVRGKDANEARATAKAYRRPQYPKTIDKFGIKVERRELTK